MEQERNPRARVGKIEIYCGFDELVDIEKVIPNPQNPNDHPESQVELLAKIIEAQGFRMPITVSNRSGFIVKGHGRLLAAKKLGMAQVPIDFQNYQSEAEEYADLIADNRLAELSNLNEESLVRLIEEIEQELPLELTGYDEESLQEILDNLDLSLDLDLDVEDDDFDIDEALEENPKSKPGEIYKLGNHRLMCGDSTKKEDVKKLMGGETADLLLTDPPYNVDYQGKSGAKLKIKNDNQEEGAFYEFLYDAISSANDVLKPGGSFYIWHADSNGLLFRMACEELGLRVRQCLIWVKNSFVMGRQDYHWKHEPCQPAGTMVRTPTGEVPIEELKDGDRVLSFDTYSGHVKGYRDGLEIKTANRHYHGKMYEIKVGDRKTKATDNHKFSVRFRDNKRNLYCVYLMRRGNWWRIGTTRAYDARGFGLKQRMRQEGGEECWIINAYDTKGEARCAEQVLSAKYGIPQTWETDQDLKALDENANRLLEDFNRSRKYPLIDKETRNNKFSCRVTAQIEACNLIAGIMDLPIPYDKYDGIKTFEWQPIDQVETEDFDGTVYSLAVDKYEHYISDGIITHNCLYGWSDGAAHYFINDRTQDTVIEDKPNLKKMSKEELIAYIKDIEAYGEDKYPTTVMHEDKPAINDVHPTMKPVKLIARQVANSSRRGEIVLDIFGGSGSTLIACEQLNRACYTMELDPRFVDVIIKRWEEFTGEKAEKIGG